MGYDYTRSGLSSTAALADARRRVSEDYATMPLSGVCTRIALRGLRLRLHCDGLGCPRTTSTSCDLDAAGFWSRSGGWTHRDDLDFCPTCRSDGSADAAVAVGVRPG